jgi:AcrR family transcriptional regulator
VRERDMVAAATTIFGQRGFESASMDEVAAAAGISKPMLYAYFGSKEGLMGACAHAAAAGLRERLAKVGSTRGVAPDQRLWQGLIAVFEFVDVYREGWRVLYPLHGVPGGALGTAGKEAREAMEQLLTGLFGDVAAERGMAPQATEQIDAIAVGFTAATIAMASAWLEADNEPKELAALRLMNLAWMGFGDMLAGRLWLPGQGEPA